MMQKPSLQRDNFGCRRYNTKADSLANLGLDEGGWNGVKTPQVCPL